jgi:hypothetical protein
MEQSAVQAYGFVSYTPAYPGGLAVGHSTATGDSMPHEIAETFGFGSSNPLFWLLILLLILTGYFTLGFNVGLKKIAKAGFKVG